ncbi:MAG: hypothetical protein AAGH15_16325 [Myxococcota bacterium]
MNTQLREMVVAAEGRHLGEAELARFREHAQGYGARLDAMRRVQDAEEGIVETALRRLEATQGSRLRDPVVRQKAERDLEQTLRYAAQAAARDDLGWFQETFSEWHAEMLCALQPQPVMEDTFKALRDAVEERLDGADARALLPFLDDFLRELASWRES